MGISAAIVDKKAVIALAAHDATYLIYFTLQHISLDGKTTSGEISIVAGKGGDENPGASGRDATKEGKGTDAGPPPPGDIIADWIVSSVQSYERSHHVKFIGAGVPDRVADELSPTLCSRLWLETDVVPIVQTVNHERSRAGGGDRCSWDAKPLDEQADSMARRCVMSFGPSLTPLLQVGFHGLVMTDAGFRARLNRLSDHQATNGETTWRAVNVFADRLKGHGGNDNNKEKKTKIAFFSATPQGGGVALMRHSLVRFSRLMDVELGWYVPKPRPGVFRSTKNMHNILQGVADKDDRLFEDQRRSIHDWITDNAKRYWLTENGPLRKAEEGGADIII